MKARAVVISAICLLYISCANQVTPAGGKKDTTPPKLTKADPPLGTVNFTSTIITLHFNEFLQTIDASKVYMTPELSKNIKIQQVHKNVIIKLTPPFRDSTTYTIHFNESIADFNEGNKLKDFEYVFSTGPVIDSLKVQGAVTDAFTNKPIKDAIIMLYDKRYDSIPFKEKPVYYGRSNEAGQYTITHIKAGTYKIFSLIDNDGDLKFSQPAEKIGFIDSNINIRSNLHSVNMRLFVNKPVKQKLLRATCTKPGVVFIKWAMPYTSNITVECKESELIFDKQMNTDSAIIYVKNVKTDSVKLFIKDGGYCDTALIMMKLPSVSGRNKMVLSLTNNLLCDKSGCTIIDTFMLRGNHPLTAVDTSRIIFYADTGKYMRRIYLKSIIKLTKGLVLFPLNSTVKSNILACIIKKGAFTDIYGLANIDSIKLKFGKMLPEQKGNLLLTITGLKPSSNNILYLLRDNERILPYKFVALKDGKISYTYKNMVPGNYTAYILEDDNKNGRWDTGDYLKHEQPEKIIVYTSAIIIRANWDNELTWEVK